MDKSIPKMNSQPPLVCTVGGSPAPILISLQAHRPDFLILVCSASSLALVKEQVLPAVSFVPTVECLVLHDEQNLLSCCADIRNGVRRILAEHEMPSDTPLRADFTGGTKVMSVSLVMALVDHPAEFSYIGGNQRNKNGLGAVQDGHEQVLHFVNPFPARNKLRTQLRELAHLFNAGHFQQAEELALAMAKAASANPLPDVSAAAAPPRPDFCTALAALCRAYALWDAFRYDEACPALANALSDLQKCSGTTPADSNSTPHENTTSTDVNGSSASGHPLFTKSDCPASPDFAAFILDVEDNLHTLEQATNEYNTFIDEDQPCPRYLNDLAANAIRREQQGRYDDAVARLYSVLEKAARTTLYCVHGLNPSNLDVSQIPAEFFAQNRPIVGHDGRLQLPLFRSYQLLAYLGDPLGLRFMEMQDVLNDLLQARNFSFLAHGFEPVTEEMCAELRTVVLHFLQIAPEQITRFARMPEIF